jgi:2'-5' RNA ligase
MAKVRAFIAIELPEAFKREVDKLILKLKPAGEGIRWVKAGNLHFTLRFLGDIEQDSIPGLQQRLAEKLKDLPPFSIKLSGLGCFPNLKRPKVIWVGADGALDELKKLAFEVESACRDQGFGEGDKAFSAHLTIGRVKFARGLEPLTRMIEQAAFETDSFEIREVVIFKSDLSPRGPTYMAMGRAELAGS